MGLDLTRTAIQIDDMAAALTGRDTWIRDARLGSALAARRSAFDPDIYRAKREQPDTDLNWIVPEIRRTA